MSVLKSLLHDEVYTSDDSSEDFTLTLDTINVSLELKDIEKQLDCLRDLDAVVFSLNDISDTLNSEISNESYQIVEKHINYLIKDFPESFIDPSLESYGNHKVSSEGVKEFAKKVVGVIKSGIDKVNKKIKGWYDKVFKAANAASSKCDKLIKRMDLEVPSNKEPKDPDFGYDLGNFLVAGQKVNDITANIKNLIEDMKSVVNNDSITKIFTEYHGNLVTLFDDMAKEKEINDQEVTAHFMELSKKALDDLAALPKSKGDNKIPKSVENGDFTITKHGCYPGNKTLYSIVPKANTNAFNEKDRQSIINVFDKCGLQIEKYSDSEYKNEGSYPVIFSSVISSILNDAKELLKNIYSYKSNLSNAEKQKSKILEGTDYILAELGASSENAKALEGIIQSMANKIVQHIDKPKMEMIDISLSTVLKICNLSEIAIKHYKE